MCLIDEKSELFKLLKDTHSNNKCNLINEHQLILNIKQTTRNPKRKILIQKCLFNKQFPHLCLANSFHCYYFKRVIFFILFSICDTSKTKFSPFHKQ